MRKLTKEIIGVAREAGDAILKFYEHDIEVSRKEDNSPLTKADMAAHQIIIGALSDIDPSTPVISEESGVPDYEIRKEWSRFWIVDPLDGTKEFIKKNGEFTVNIALIDGGEPVLGVVSLPAKNMVYYASNEEGAFKIVNDRKPFRIYSERADKNKPLKIVQSRSHGSDKLEQQLSEQGIDIGDSVKAGSSLKFCLVAEGKADIYPRMGPTMEWDVAAGDCVYRNSARKGRHESPLKYNKKDLLNDGFIIGL